MKLISLNSWGCRIEKPIFKFISDNSKSTDIFNFQEILKGGQGKTQRKETKSAFKDIGSLLPDHTGYFFEYGDGGHYSEKSGDLDFKYGIATFIRSTIDQAFVKGVELYDPNKKWPDYAGGFAVGAAMSIKAGDYCVINVHGLWQGGIKSDTEAKKEQSEKVIDLAENCRGLKIISGDFNLLPDTKSVQMIGNEYMDLIQEYKITDTRGALYSKEFRYSDYAFADSRIKVNNFQVLNVEVSDHLPLVIEFD